jgi:hypothetical protein
VDKDHQGYYSLNDQTTTNQDAHGTAYRLDGTNDKIAAAHDAELDITTGDFSMYREVYVPSLTAAITLWEKWEDAGDYWYLQIETTGAITFKTAIATVTKGHYTTAAGLVTAGTNVKIGFVSDRDGTKGQFYVNLLPVTTTETTAMAATSITNTGALNWGFDGATGYSEYEDQYGSLWNLAHSAAEVKDVKNIPFKWQYGSQTNIITGDNVDFGADAVDKTAFDVAYDQWTVNANPTSIAVATNVLSITAAASNDGIYMTALEIGKEYTLSINVSSITGTWNIESPLNTNVATITATGQQTLNFIANDTLLRIYASAASDQISIDASAISNNLVPLGAVALYDNTSISASTWYDKANGNDGTVTGASVLNPLPVATDSDNIPIFSVTSGITADTGSAQGNGVLTSSINQIATCANAGDAVTLPSAKPGKVLWVTNDGANAADVFPASGDNIDEAGANTALSVAVDAEVQFICTSSGHWSTITSA